MIRCFSVHIREVKGGEEGWGISQNLSSDRIYLRLCQALWPVMDTNDPNNESCVFQGSFFYVLYNCLESDMRTRWPPPLAENPPPPKGDLEF